ncbi:hypothetical protein MYX78_01915 [Acidobacteria bacterium AH-259-G07]|nr:hypothetical protein [Acidobacteria bacterium AH-259-G07]
MNGTPKIAVSVLILVCAVAPLTAQLKEHKIDPKYEPPEIAPHIYSVVLENEWCRVMRVLLNPGEKEPYHMHRPYVAVTMQGGKLKHTHADGKVTYHFNQPGDVNNRPSGALHDGENVGDTTLEFLIVEFKGDSYKGPKLGE